MGVSFGDVPLVSRSALNALNSVGGPSGGERVETNR